LSYIEQTHALMQTHTHTHTTHRYHAEIGRSASAIVDIGPQNFGCARSFVAWGVADAVKTSFYHAEFGLYRSRSVGRIRRVPKIWKHCAPASDRFVKKKHWGGGRRRH